MTTDFFFLLSYSFFVFCLFLIYLKVQHLQFIDHDTNLPWHEVGAVYIAREEFTGYVSKLHLLNDDTLIFSEVKLSEQNVSQQFKVVGELTLPSSNGENIDMFIYKRCSFN
jgi:hypothetical protein